MTDATSTSPRRFTRVPCNVAAMVAFRDAQYSGVCQNLSVGGAYFRGGSAPSATDVDIVLCIPSLGPVELHGEVCHSEADGVGVRFKQIPSQALSALCAYVGTS